VTFYYFQKHWKFFKSWRCKKRDKNTNFKNVFYIYCLNQSQTVVRVFTVFISIRCINGNLYASINLWFWWQPCKEAEIALIGRFVWVQMVQRCILHSYFETKKNISVKGWMLV